MFVLTEVQNGGLYQIIFRFLLFILVVLFFCSVVLFTYIYIYKVYINIYFTYINLHIYTYIYKVAQE